MTFNPTQLARKLVKDTAPKFLEAKKTGKPVELKSREEVRAGVKIKITEWVLPNGRTETRLTQV